MTGVSAIQYFSVDIFGQIGISPDNALKYQAINGILALIAQATCMATIDKFGRRRVIIWGMLFNCLTFIIATILLAIFPPSTNSGNTAGWGFIITYAQSNSLDNKFPPPSHLFFLAHYFVLA